MKKFFTLLTAAVAVSAMAQVSVDDIAGKYRLVPGYEPKTYIEDNGFNAEEIIVIDKTGDKSFAIENFYYDLQNYDAERLSLNGTWYDLGEWANYPTVQNIQFQWDNTDMYLYNPAGETEDTRWLFFNANSFRLLPKKTADGNTQLYLWPNNKILLSYYSATNGSYDNPALEFENLGAWSEGKEGSLHLERLPQYTTVTKRGLVGDYVVSGKDNDGNVLSYNVSIALDGTSYVMTGLFGDTTHPLTFTWDASDAGIHAKYLAEYDEEGYYTFCLESYAASMNIFVSFTEDGNLAFDHSLYYFDGENEIVLNGATTAAVEYDPLDQFVGTYTFTGTDPYCEDADYAPLDTYTCYITKEDGELHMTGFLGEVDDDATPWYTGTYNEVTQEVYFYCVDAYNGCYVVDNGIWYYVYDFTLNASKNEAGNMTLTRDGAFYFYAYTNDWINASYSSLTFERISSSIDKPSIEPAEPVYVDFAEQSGTALGYFADYDGYSLGLDNFGATYTRSGRTITLTNFLNAGKDLVITLEAKDNYGDYPTSFAYGDGFKDGVYFYLFESEEEYITYGNETIDTFYLNGYSYYYNDDNYDWLTICYYSNMKGEYDYINIDFTEEFTGIKQLKTNRNSSTKYFDLQGRRTNANNAFVVVENGKATKRMAK